MRISKSQIMAIVVALCLAATVACSNGNEASEQPVEARITVVTSISGPGDNGYNDQILEGVTSVINASNVEFSLVRPASMNEAKTTFLNWKSKQSSQSELIVMAGSDYEDLVRENASGLTDDKTVLLFESDGEGMPSGVKTFRISRYGVSYLAGCMAQGSDEAYVLLAMKGDDTIEEAAQGFADGYKAHSTDGQLHTDYLAESIEGYSMPDSAYRWTSNKSTAFVYPLAGGSNNGVYKYTRETLFTELLVAGMDVDCSAYSIRVPFSVIIDIKKATADYLSDWINGKELPDKKTFSLEDGIADIKMNDTFIENLDVWEDYYYKENYWIDMYNQYKSEAIGKEAEYED